MNINKIMKRYNIISIVFNVISIILVAIVALEHAYYFGIGLLVSNIFTNITILYLQNRKDMQ